MVHGLPDGVPERREGHARRAAREHERVHAAPIAQEELLGLRVRRELAVAHVDALVVDVRERGLRRPRGARAREHLEHRAARDREREVAARGDGGLKGTTEDLVLYATRCLFFCVTAPAFLRNTHSYPHRYGQMLLRGGQAADIASALHQ